MVSLFFMSKRENLLMTRFDWKESISIRCLHYVCAYSDEYSRFQRSFSAFFQKKNICGVLMHDWLDRNVINLDFPSESAFHTRLRVHQHSSHRCCAIECRQANAMQPFGYIWQCFNQLMKNRLDGAVQETGEVSSASTTLRIHPSIPRCCLITCSLCSIRARVRTEDQDWTGLSASVSPSSADREYCPWIYSCSVS